MRRSAKGHSRLTRMLPRHDVVLTGEQQPRRVLQSVRSMGMLGEDVKRGT